PPSALAAASRQSRVSCPWLRSALMKCAFTPNSSSRLTRSLSMASASRNPLITTCAPLEASSRAMARPIPLVDPVTTARLLVSIRCPFLDCLLGAPSVPPRGPGCLLGTTIENQDCAYQARNGQPNTVTLCRITERRAPCAKNKNSCYNAKLARVGHIGGLANV